MYTFAPVPPHPKPPVEHTWQEIVGFFLGNTILYILVAGLSVAIKMTNNWYAAESARKEMEKSRTEAELQNLKSQLNPHFLFNTLNNIYSLIAFSPERAQEAVHDLSRLLRYVLYESSQPYVAISKELDFIKNYVELMRIRLPEHVELTINISPEIKGDIRIAPLLYISLIENAFKHGISNNKPSFIRLEIYPLKERIVCSITNSSFPKNEKQDKSGSGIGLSNLEKRLNLLYPNRHIFTCALENEEYHSELIIHPEKDPLV
ncbi:MAG: histidine kinase [Tannerellaceae bacterium]|nr:histidine kinase [Tannerellaceae bacterium]